MKVSLLVFTLNEVDGMKAIIPSIDRSLFHEIIVVDGGSNDGTVEWSRGNGYQVWEQRRKGLRFGYSEIFPQLTGEVVITFSPDGNSPVDVLPKLIAAMAEGYDMVIGSRYLGGAKSEDDTPITAFGNWAFTRAINLLHGGRYTDAMTMYRAYRKDLYFDLGMNRDDGYDFCERFFNTIVGIEPLLSVRALKRHCKIAEVLALEPKRITGESKLQTFRWGACYALQVVRELWHWR
jgi:glycosyltransferase involved in cell wall biosynthesis